MQIQTIGRHSYIGGGGDITCPVVVGNFTSIAPGVKMHPRIQHPCMASPVLVASGSGRALPGYPRPLVEHGITIGHDVWIGEGVVLLGHITIGHGAIVGAYSVVAKSIPPYAVAMGNPVQIKRYRFDRETMARLLTVEWWNWPDEVIAERADALRDVRVLVETYGYDVCT